MSLILAVNAGSSSLKISLFQRQVNDPPRLVLTSSTSSISSPPAKFTFKIVDVPGSELTNSGHKESAEADLRDHESAFGHFIDKLARYAEDLKQATQAVGKDRVNLELGQIRNVCHRVVHGGNYVEPVVITEQTYHHIERLSDLAPLHNGAALRVIHAAITVLPNSRSIAFFDTAFHKHLPPHVAAYAIDQNVARKRGLRKYGFHGLSYAFITRSVAQYLGEDPTKLNIIALHIGSGASACAIRGGKSTDTSMGLTPLSGLPGATRAGDIDPSLIFHYTSQSPLDVKENGGEILSHKEGVATEVHISDAERILNTQMGWKALAGTTDFGEIVRKAFPRSALEKSDDDKYKLAFNLLLDRILHFVGAYYLALRGDIHALVFAGGVGEHSVELRSKVGEAVRCLGFVALDEGANRGADSREGVVVDIGNGGQAGKKVLVCRTDEQGEMARECSIIEGFW
ncbi:Acetokinase family-domain-containing protein [Pisolithus orientalis]|uniref:Acetokinase family-domain-containing protein n=1 Tax=Pisolithus orientalis TaxID=936130 RepID=UPI00222487BD|nr:Acetokinase family-domain-containing protein [Pisolithus orientalis]KAI5989614.1 Acetokinase family-domain-containing protein [Pisolithus orientalis]